MREIDIAQAVIGLEQGATFVDFASPPSMPTVTCPAP